jgi:NitT/TauT family transport system substrate-binding protein
VIRTFICFALATALGSASALANEAVRVAVSSTTNLFATTYIAKEKGFFADRGLDVSITDVGGGTNVVASLVGGSADVGLIGLGNLVQARSKGQDLRAFATSTRGFPNYIVVSKSFKQASGLDQQSPIEQRIKSLKGKTIGVNDVGGSAGDFVRELLRRGGMKEDDVTIINLPSSAGRLAAIKASRIDAAVAYSPEPETALVEGFGETYIDALKDIPETKGLEWIVIAAKEGYIAKNKETLAKFVAALGAAAELIERDPQEAEKAYLTQYKAKSKGAAPDPKVLSLVWESMKSYIAMPPAVSREALSRAYTYFKAPAAVSLDSLADFEVAPASARK